MGLSSWNVQSTEGFLRSRTKPENTTNRKRAELSLKPHETSFPTIWGKGQLLILEHQIENSSCCFRKPELCMSFLLLNINSLKHGFKGQTKEGGQTLDACSILVSWQWCRLTVHSCGWRWTGMPLNAGLPVCSTLSHFGLLYFIFVCLKLVLLWRPGSLAWNSLHKAVL